METPDRARSGVPRRAKATAGADAAARPYMRERRRCARETPLAVTYFPTPLQVQYRRR